jgi:hypothetical protein
MKLQELNNAVSVSRLEPSLPQDLPFLVPVNHDLRLRCLLEISFLLCLRYIGVAFTLEDLPQKPLQLKLHDLLIEVLDADDDVILDSLYL